jgi:hypothetical protein
MADPVPEVPSTEKYLDTRIAAARTELRSRFLFVYEKCVKGTGIGMYNIITYAAQEHISNDTWMEMSSDGWIKKWLEEDPKGPRKEKSNAEKMQKYFLKICEHNYENFKIFYRQQGLFTRDWDRIFTALTAYLEVLTEKIALDSSWQSYLKWKFTGQGRQVSVEHLLMQLKNVNETDDSENHL